MSGDVADVSVLVPSYNHARFVGETLRSIFRQTLAPRELLVIDDGSADDSARVAGRALEECAFPCELIARGNRGLCATLNEGLARTRGRYFAYLGSDDLWLPGLLAARVRARTDVPLGVGVGVSTRAQAAEVAAYADAVIVGSAFVRTLLDAPNAGAGVRAAAALTSELAEGVRR